ncbi:MAG: serine/threonine protein kinase [Thermoanaerobaculia bacterium]|nr:serine/threonine protein kinase [Thermoanaerobaculia bacterium]
MSRDDGPRAATYSEGSLVDGRFRIVALLGRGGLSEVYRAVVTEPSGSLHGGEEVALKIVMPELLGSDKAISRFKREMRWTQRIDHPNVISVKDFVLLSHDGTELPCLVMELLEGESLVEYLERRGVMSGEEAKPIVCQMAAALDAAHRAGIVHRDLKPANVILVPRTADDVPRVVLTDFGVAREDKSTDLRDDSQSLTASNVILGTPDYLAPEQLELEEALPASDLYALGLCFYQMVTGSLPFEADSPLEAVFQRVQKDAPSPSLKRPDLEANLEKVILRCLARDPEDRYSSGAEIIRDLDGQNSGYLTAIPRRRVGTEVWVSLATIGILLLVAIVVAVIYASKGM